MDILTIVFNMLYIHALKEYLNLYNKTNKSKFLKYVFFTYY